MKKGLFQSVIWLAFILITTQSRAQSVVQPLLHAFEQLDKDTCLKKADISFCLLDINTGKVIVEKNKDKLLAPASTLKTFTTATALYVLGENYQYQTKVTFKGTIQDKVGKGTLIIYGAGDPSLGSDRYDDTKPDKVFQQIVKALKSKGIEQLEGNIIVNKSIYTDENINKDWLDEDVGNYYGAGIYPLNWKENKFEINLVPTTSSFEVLNNTAGYDNKKDFCIELIHKEGATTEEAFAYIEKSKSCMYNIKGVLSAKEATQNMQLARLTPDKDFIRDLSAYLKKEMAFKTNNIRSYEQEIEITRIVSPPLAQLVYWCNQKSLNLYAESFCKTIASHMFKAGSWRLGISAMMRYANALKINTRQVQLKDGCGLAETNRITTYVLASMLQRNTKEKNHQTFYASLPSINGLNMKSGYIGGTRSYAGYITLKDSTKASFAFIIHGYTCTPKEVKSKMFQVLDKMK
jgi:D-alanyl-D-alanine carboxypeptidase/D-alanyl-D-alanine-endopeptidase (penicillin-binding protein 4)